MVMAWLFQLEITCLVPISATLEVYHDTPNLFMSPSIFIIYWSLFNRVVDTGVKLYPAG